MSNHCGDPRRRIGGTDIQAIAFRSFSSYDLGDEIQKIQNPFGFEKLALPLQGGT